MITFHRMAGKTCHILNEFFGRVDLVLALVKFELQEFSGALAAAILAILPTIYSRMARI